MKRFLQVFLAFISLTFVCFAQNSNSQITRLRYKLDVGNSTDRVRYTFFSPDGKKVLLINENSTQVWSSETGKLLLTFPETISLKNGQIFEWQPSGTKILQYNKILPDKNSAAYLWNTENGKLISILSETRGVTLAEWNRDGDKILTVGDFEHSIDDKKVSFSIRDETGKQVRTEDIRTHSLFSIRFANGEDNVIASYRVDYRYDFKEKPIRVYEAETGKLTRSYDQELKKTASSDYAIFRAESPDGQFICGEIYFSKGLACWKNSGSESPIYYFLDRKETGDISFLSFSRDSKSFAISKPKAKIIELVDAETGQTKATLENPDKARLCFYPHQLKCSSTSGDSWSPTGKFFVATNFEKEAYIWNAQTGKLIAKLPVIYDDDYDWFVGTLVSNYESFSFHPNEKILLSVSDRAVRLWKPETGALLQEIKEIGKDKSQPSFQRDIAGWSPDGNLLITVANENKSVLLWEVRP